MSFCRSGTTGSDIFLGVDNKLIDEYKNLCSRYDYFHSLMLIS